MIKHSSHLHTTPIASYSQSNPPHRPNPQVWLPDQEDVDAHGNANQHVLKTKGMPFCIAGFGDLLALFRCVSCRFAFGINPSHPHTLGAPGRVYISNTPEVSLNVQQYSKTAYLRLAEAEQCHIQSSFLAPVFLHHGSRDQCVAILEIVTSSVMMDVVATMADLSKALESVGLCTCDREIVNQLIPNRTANNALPNNVYILDKKGDGIDEQQKNGIGNGNGNGGDNRNSSSNEESLNNSDSQDNGNDNQEHEEEVEDEVEGELQKKGHKKRKRGKQGVQLSLEKLQSQFGVGLKDAAARLGVCATTLKRACRKHGIQRWPRRAIHKVSRALDDMERREGTLATAGGGGGEGGGGDSRWGVLASFIPAYHSSAPAAGTAAGGGTIQNQHQQQQHQLPEEEPLPEGLVIIKQHATAPAPASAMPPPPHLQHQQQYQQHQNQQQQLQQPLLALPGLSIGPSLSQLSFPPLPSEFDSFANANDNNLWSVDPSMLEFLMTE